MYKKCPVPCGKCTFKDYCNKDAVEKEFYHVFSNMVVISKSDYEKVKNVVFDVSDNSYPREGLLLLRSDDIKLRTFANEAIVALRNLS